MSENKKNNKLNEMTNLISGSLNTSTENTSRNYEYSAAFTVPKIKQIIGCWKIIEHTVDNIPYEKVFCEGTFKDVAIENVQYEATYEFTQNLCIKRVMIFGDLDLSDNQTSYDYRMNIVLSWELKPGMIHVLPVLGYQYTSLDGKPATVKDLPHSNSWLKLSVRFENDCMILEDGTDIKKLGRLS